MTIAAPPSPSEVDVPVAGSGPQDWDLRDMPRGSPLLSDWILDSVSLVVLGAIALWGFDAAFGGHIAIAVGGTGFLAAALWSILASKWRISVVLTMVGAVVIYLVVGTLFVVPGTAVAMVLPSPTSVRELVDGAIRGWSNVLTTPTPIGHTRNLLAVPLFSAVAAATLGFNFARRLSRLFGLAVIPLLLLLGAGIIVGVGQPISLVQGTMFAVVGSVWIAVRQRRMRRGETHVSIGNSRLAGAAVILVIAGIVGTAVGSTSFVSGDDHRVVVRDRVEPPIDLRRYPSPLEAYRYFKNDLETTEMFVITGLPAGQRIRLATLDSYDGVVWQVTPSSGTRVGSEVFRRVGQTIPTTSAGEEATASVVIRSYEGIWVPTIGATRSISFQGPNAVRLYEGFRYNIVTNTGVEPGGLGSPDAYSLEAVIPSDSAYSSTTVGVVGTQSVEVPVAVTQWLDRQQPTGSALEQVVYVAELLQKTGYYSDGRLDRDQEPSQPGHGSQRLAAFLANSTERGKAGTVGNAEQYAATLALVAADRGLASRVVMGFKATGATNGATVITGKDVTAWVEVAGPNGWITLDPTPDSSRTQIELSQTPLYPPNPLASEPPPPTPTIPRDDLSSGGGSSDCAAASACRSTSLIPAWMVKVVGYPLLVVSVFAVLAAALIGAKARRRAVRRRTGSPAQRVAAGWMEVCDLATDVGDAVPIKATRREAAVLMPRVGAADLAQRADRAIFGPEVISEEDADRYWYFVDTTRAGMLASLGRWERWRVMVNPTSLRLTRFLDRVSQIRFWKRATA